MSRKEKFASRPAPLRVSSLFPVADALLGAAHSDITVHPSEFEAVRSILCDILHVDRLPYRLEQRLAEFDPMTLDLALTCAEVDAGTAVGRRTLLELTKDVCDADGEIHILEDRYMLALAMALSMQPEEYDDLVFDTPFKGFNGVLKRIQDIVLGTIFLFVSLAPMLLVGLAVKLTSKGPVFFRQRRYGVDGVEFEMLKFRSMIVTEDGDKVEQAQKDDPRTTPVGKFIRRKSLDELPQFINVIKGDMSIVGPRPHAVAHNEMYRKQILEYMRRHKVKPGLTGWAQVNGFRGETDTLEKMVRRVEHDLYYIRNWSLWLDIKCIWMTVFGRKVRQNAH